MTAPAEVPAGAALDHAPTRDALARHRRRAGGWALASLGLGVAAVAYTVQVGAEGRIWSALCGWSVGAGIGAVVVLVRWRRLRRILGAGPWVARRAHHELAWHGRYEHAIVVLEAEAGRPEAVCLVRDTRGRQDLLGPDDTDVTLWVAGDPTSYAVAARPGAPDLVPISPPRTAWGRRRVRARALR